MENKEKGGAMSKDKIFEQYSKQKYIYDIFGKKMVDLLEGLLKSNEIKYQTINYRIKEEEKFKNKVIKKDKYNDIKDITDVCGIRIVTSYSDTVDKVAEIISNQFEVDEENTIDKRKALDPDKFGYLSLHYIVSLKEDRLKLPEYSMFRDIKVEIQIRSISQHTWAEIEHDLGYKSEVEIPREIRRDFSRLASLLELVDKEFIEVREKIKEYASKSEKDIKVLIKESDNKENISNEATEINKVTLDLYVKSSQELTDLSKSISKFMNRDIKPDLPYADNYMWNLINAGFKTIQDIDYELKSNKNHIQSFCENLINKYSLFEDDRENNRPKYFPASIGLFYLSYYRVAKEKSKYAMDEYINKCGIHTDNLMEEFIELLMESYENA